MTRSFRLALLMALFGAAPAAADTLAPYQNIPLWDAGRVPNAAGDGPLDAPFLTAFLPPFGDGEPRERPAHDVVVDAFYIGQVRDHQRRMAPVPRRSRLRRPRLLAGRPRRPARPGAVLDAAEPPWRRHARE